MRVVDCRKLSDSCILRMISKVVTYPIWLSDRTPKTILQVRSTNLYHHRKMPIYYMFLFPLLLS